METALDSLGQQIRQQVRRLGIAVYSTVGMLEEAGESRGMN